MSLGLDLWKMAKQELEDNISNHIIVDSSTTELDNATKRFKERQALSEASELINETKPKKRVKK